MPKMEILVGMIGSGKSTYCRSRAAAGAVIVDLDAIVSMIHGGDYTAYTKANKVIYKSAELAVAHTAFAMGNDVIIDRTGITRSQRAKYIAIAKSLDILIQITHFKIETPEIHAKRRAEGDSRGVSYERWLEIAEHHFEVYDKPDESEGYDEIYYMPDSMMQSFLGT